METKEYKLTEVCDFQGGTQPPKEEWIDKPQEGYVRMLQIRDFTQGKAEFIEYVKDTKKLNKCNADDILIGRYGASVGKILTGLEGAYNVAIMKTIPDETKLLKKFLYYILSGGEFQNFIRKGIGARAAQAGFSKDDLTYFKLHLPSLENQERIATILTKAEELIKQRKQSIQSLEEILNNLFNKRFIEQSHPLETLNNLTKKITDGEHKKPDYKETGMPFISVVNITKGFLNFENCKFVSHEDHLKFNKRCNPQKNDILYSKVGATYGRAVIVDTERPFSLYVSVALLKPDSNKINSNFLKFAMNHPFVKRQADRAIKGAGVPDLHLVEIKSFKIPLPSMKEQVDFSIIVDNFLKIKSFYQNSLIELENLFGSLSQRAFRGELNIIEKIEISGTIKIQPKISGEVIVIDKINKELADFHKSIPDSGSPADIDNTLKQLDAELKIRGELKFWDEYVKQRIIKDKFSGGFTFEEFWNEFSKVPFDEPQSYDKIKELIFSWLKTEKPFLKQTFNEKEKRIELSVNETA